MSSTPASYTPHVKTGKSVHENVVVGDTVYIGGSFTQLEDSSRTQTYDRSNFAAYSVTTGQVAPLDLHFNGAVNAMVATPNGAFLYAGGAFTAVDGVRRKSLVRIRLSDGAVMDSFSWPGGGVVSDLRFSRGRLFVAGNFPQKLLALRRVTGVDTGLIDVAITGTLSGYAGKVDKIAINPSGTDLVAIGDFTHVDGYRRRSAFRLSLGTAAVLTNWHPARFGVSCKPTVPYYLRDVDWAPDGSYFVIVSSGGPYGGYPETGFCDGAGRWEASSAGRSAEPTWINWTGGDSLYSVAVSDSAVYVGGHQRWLDNPQGHDSAGPGAYAVDSIGVIDPTTGLANRTWEARPMTRAHGKEDLTLFSGGLVVGGDGYMIAGSYHRGTAVFPYCDADGDVCPTPTP